MRNNILPHDFAKKVMPLDENGKPVVTFPAVRSYVKFILPYLQTQQISLNTPDFVDTIIQSLELYSSSALKESGLILALYDSQMFKYYSPAAAEQELYCEIVAWLEEQGFSTETLYYYKAIVTADYPMPSKLNPRKIAVWRNTSKMVDWDKRQAVSVRKWIGSTLKGLTAEQAESLAKRIDKYLASLIELDIRHHSSYEFDAWELAYSSNKIRSCMNTNSNSEVGYKRTFTCYCTGYHGLPDNGLNLTVLYQDDTPVARAITFSDGEQKYYVRSYGDDRLERWMRVNGYEQESFLVDTILYTDEDLIKPYVDGDVYMSDHYINSDGQHHWVLRNCGDYNLQTVEAYATHPVECECCGYKYPEDETQVVYSYVNSNYYTVCRECKEINSYAVYTAYTGRRYTESRFFHDGDSPDSNNGYAMCDGEYYAIDSLNEYGLHLIDGEVYPADDLYHCEKTDEWFTDSSDAVYTCADEISTTQPVLFSYECISKEYWDANVVETACGTLALSDDTREISTPSLGSVITLDGYWNLYTRCEGTGILLTGIVFNLDAIERDYDYDPTEKMQAFRDYAIAYNTIQFLRFQELGI